jgi:hypothetical protein
VKHFHAIEVDLNNYRRGGRLKKAWTDKPEVGETVIAYESEEQIGFLMKVRDVRDIEGKDYWLVGLETSE